MSRYLYFINDILLLFFGFLVNIFSFQLFRLNNYPSVKKNKKSIIIVNGPSLKKDIKKILNRVGEFEFYGVNYFAMTKMFKIIKPNYYAFADPIFWRKDISPQFKKDNSKLFKILSKVNWNMHLICPIAGARTVSERLKKNKNIKVIPLRSHFYYFRNERFNIFALYIGIVTPIFNNVLTVALWHALQRKVPYIKLYGADFSLFKELSVDQHTNELKSLYSHFYKNTKAQANTDKKYPNRKKKKLHNTLLQIWNSFNQIYLLSVIAKKKKIKLINCSSYSYLDTIDRPTKIKKRFKV
jgi:hypothetical protein